MPEIAGQHRVAVTIHAIGEVLARHADDATLPPLQVALVDKFPLLHSNPCLVQLYYSRSEVIGNGSAHMGGDHDRPEEAPAIRMSHCWVHRCWFIRVKGHLAFALLFLTAAWFAPFREDAAKRYLPSTPQPSLLAPEENRGLR